MVNPTLAHEAIVNAIQIDNISLNLDGNSYVNDRRCPKVDCKSRESENHHLASNTNILFKVYHQSIRGLKDKVQEFTTSLFPERPHVLTEHIDKADEIDIISTENYNLG
jgi:hypothetical protein